MSLTSVIFRNSLWVVLDRVIGLLLPTVTSILVARAMGPTKLGHYNYIMWVAQAAVIFGALGVPEAVQVYVSECFGRRDTALARSIYRTALVFQALAGTGFVAAGLVVIALAVGPEHRTYAALGVLSILPAALLGVATSVNAAMQDFRANIVPSIVGMFVQAAGIIATLVWGWDLVGLAASLLASRVVDAALRFLMLQRRLPAYLRELSPEGGRGRTELPPALRRELAAFCGRATVLLVLNWVVWNRSETFFLERFCEIREVAFFSIAFSFAGLPAALSQPFSWTAALGLYHEYGRSPAAAKAYAAVYARYLALLVVPTSVGLSVLSGPLVRLFYGPAYEPAVAALAVAAAAGMIPAVVPPARVLATAAGGQYLILRVTLVTAAVTLLLDWWLVRSYAALGGVIANSAGQSLYTVAMFVVASRWFGLRAPWAFLGRLLAISAAGGAAIWTLARFAPHLAAVTLGPPLGLLAFVVLFRAGRVADSEDRRRVDAVLGTLPNALRAPFRRAAALVLG